MACRLPPSTTDEGLRMRNLELKRRSAISSASPSEDIVASVTRDFMDLAEILARMSAQRLDFDGQQLDCLIRANAAATRGIELSSRLSDRLH